MTTNGKSTIYIPERQDVIWIDFDPSLGTEIRKRRPAVVLSSKKYSTISGLALVAPITHATNNQLRQLFLPVHMQKIDGYINTLQFYTLDYKKRNAEYVDMLPTATFAILQQRIVSLITS